MNVRTYVNVNICQVRNVFFFTFLLFELSPGGDLEI